MHSGPNVEAEVLDNDPKIAYNKSQDVPALTLN
jgi:hypothetical protein